MEVQSWPASRPVIGVAPVRAVVDPGWVVGDADRVTGCALAAIEPAGLGVAVTVGADRPGTAPGARALPPQAASAASVPAISIARTASSILMS